MTDYEDLAPRRRTLVTFALLGCAFLAMLDGTVIGTALPRIVSQLGGSDSWYVWLVTAYLLTSSITVPIYGRFSDLYGRRPLVLGGLAVFLAGSLACGLAGSMGPLIVFRTIQGLGAGALLTLGMSLLRDLYPPGRMTGMIRMQTLMAGMMVVGMVGGPLIGGLLVDHAGWRWTFLINLPIGAVAAIMITVLLPDRRPEPHTGKLDLAGIAMLSAGLSMVLVGLSLKGNTSRGWGDPGVLGLVLGGLALLVALAYVERRAATPILPPRLLRRRTFAALLASGFFFQVAVLPVGVFVPLYLQHVRGYSATASGLMLLPLLIGMTAGNRLTAAAMLKLGRVKPLLLTGAALITVGSAAFFALDPDTSPLALGGWLLLVGVGTGQLGGSVGLACAQTFMSQPAAVGTTIGWMGAVAGLLAFAALLPMSDVRLAEKVS